MDSLSADFHIWNLVNKNKFRTQSIYIAPEISELKKNFLFKSLNPFNFKPEINFIQRIRTTKAIEEADYVLVPHPWISILKNYEYLNYLKKLSEVVPLIIANTDDRSPRCNLSNTLQIRTFLHPKEKNFRKIIFPYPAKGIDARIRNWKPIPKVSFMGFIPRFSLGSLTSKSASFFKSPIKSSVYLNRKISQYKLRNLRGRFDINCVFRDQFTLLPENKQVEKHINEYRLNMSESDYIVCPRGFANTSIRFYEALSSGATPILINSGNQLPSLKENSFWEKNIIRCDLFSNWEDSISRDWEYLSIGSNYLLRQLENKKIFKEELNLESFALNTFRYYLK